MRNAHNDTPYCAWRQQQFLSLYIISKYLDMTLAQCAEFLMQCCRWMRCEIWWLDSTSEFEPLAFQIWLRQDVPKLCLSFFPIIIIASIANLDSDFARYIDVAASCVDRNRHWLTWLVIVFLPHLHLLERYQDLILFNHTQFSNTLACLYSFKYQFCIRLFGFGSNKPNGLKVAKKKKTRAW